MSQSSDFVNYYEKHNLHLIRIAKGGHDAGKRPADTGWQKTPLDYSEAREWFAGGGNLGWCVGPRYLVLDIDPRNGGDDSFDHLMADLSLDPKHFDTATPIIITGGGGRHIYLQRDQSTPMKPGPLKGYKGIDIKTGASQVVIAGSTHPSGLPYTPDIHSTWPEEPIKAPIPLTELLSRSASAIQSQEPVADGAEALVGCVSLDQCGALLEYIDPAELGSYETWISRLAAIHHATGGEGLDLAIAWSSRDPEYSDVAEEQVRRRWRSFDSPHDFPATIHTLLADVYEVGAAEPVVEEIKQALALAEFDDLANLKTDLCERIDKLPGGGWSHNDIAATEIIKDALALTNINQSLIHQRIAKKLSVSKVAIVAQASAERKKAKAEVKTKSDKKSIPLSDFVLMVQSLAVDRLRACGQYLTRAPNEQYYIYNGALWEKAGRERVMKLAYDSARDIQNSNKKIKHELTNVIDKTEKFLRTKTYVGSENLFCRDKPHSVINTLNGTIWIDYTTGGYALRPHHPGDYLTTQIPVEYDPDATCPAFDEMLEQVFGHISENDRPELIRHFWELVGYVIQPHKDIALIMFWYGTGFNGKTTIAGFLDRLIGRTGSLPIDMEELGNGRNTHALEAVEGKLILIDDDLKSDAKLSDGALKKFSESKDIQVNPKYRPSYSARINVTPIILTNGFPIIRDLSKGLQRRMDVMPFETDLTPYRGSDLPRIARETEMPGILNRALEGLKRVRVRGGFDRPEASINASRRFFGDSNNVAAFLDHCTTAGGECKIYPLYASYVAFCMTNGERHNTERFARFKAMIAQLDYMITSDYTVKGISMQLEHADDY